MKNLLLVVVLSFGCSSVTRLHVNAAQVTRTVVDSAGDSIEAVCTVKAVRDLVEAGRRAEAIQMVDRCEAAAESQHVAVELWQDWVSALMVAQTGQDFDVALALHIARRLIRTYVEVRDLLSSLGVDAPGLPSELTSLAGVRP